MQTTIFTDIRKLIYSDYLSIQLGSQKVNSIFKSGNLKIRHVPGGIKNLMSIPDSWKNFASLINSDDLVVLDLIYHLVRY